MSPGPAGAYATPSECAPTAENLVQTLSRYLGTGGEFDGTMGDFALAYADQAEHDHAALKAAVSHGKIKANTEA
jgi:hypothetical protein